MQIGAVIVAAGMSSRMGEFKPMLNIGSISIAQRVIATFRQAGVTRIAVVTGHNAQELERHLAPSGVVFLRNKNYATTHMFDSAKIGLEYMRDKCDRVFFTPVDIPLFTADTVIRLLNADAEIAMPVCNLQTGHPILISSSVIDRLFTESADRGLQGAIESSGVEVKEVSVDDGGILHDADTPEDYRRLLEYHNRQLVRPEISVSLKKERTFFDRRIAMLLALIDETSSVRLACERMKLSYSSGWKTINGIEQQLGRKLVNRSPGGANGGGSTLTADGKVLLERFNRFEAKVRASAEEIYKETFSDFS